MAKQQDKKAEEITVTAAQEPVELASAKEAYAQHEKRLQVQKAIKEFSSFAEIQKFMSNPQQFIADAKAKSDERFSDMSVQMMNDVKKQMEQDLKENEVTAEEKAQAQEATRDPIGRAMFKAATAALQTSEKVEAKTFLQRIKSAVEKGIENINAKVAEVKVTMDAKKQDRQQAREQRNSVRIEKEVKKAEQGGNVLERMAQKAKDKTAALGDKAMAKIMKLQSKSRGAEMRISEPFNVQKHTAISPDNAATAPANATAESMSSVENDAVLAAPKPSDDAMDLEWASIEAAVDEALGDMEIVQQNFATDASKLVAQTDKTQTAQQAPEAAKSESSAPVEKDWQKEIDDQLNSIDFNKKADAPKTNDSGSAPPSPRGPG